MLNALGCKANVLRLIHCSSKLKKCALHGPTTDSPQITDWLLLNHESQDLITVGQHDLRIKTLSKYIT